MSEIEELKEEIKNLTQEIKKQNEPPKKETMEDYLTRIVRKNDNHLKPLPADSEWGKMVDYLHKKANKKNNG